MWESIVGVSYIVNNIARTEEPFGCIKYDKYDIWCEASMVRSSG